MPIDIKRALPSDAPDLSALHDQALPPGWLVADIAASCGDTSRIVLKAVNGAVLLGFAIFQFAADEAEILSIAVAKETRRRGIGSSLMEAAIAACQKKLISRIYLEVAEGNAAARRLYEKFGFLVIAHRKNYYQAARPAPETALIMRLDTGRGLSQIDRQTGAAQ
ncbi:MAG: ribosomal protein S18-alanine N-acetyltransferase [Rhodomicrobium sp.]